MFLHAVFESNFFLTISDNKSVFNVPEYTEKDLELKARKVKILNWLKVSRPMGFSIWLSVKKSEPASQRTLLRALPSMKNRCKMFLKPGLVGNVYTCLSRARRFPDDPCLRSSK